MFKKIFTTLLLAIISITFLSACGSNAQWQVEVNLTPIEQQRVEAEIKEAKEIIATEQKNNTKGSAMAYVILARAYEKQGDRKKAAKVYTDAITYGVSSVIIHNNLGKLYERVGEYKMAIEQYNILIGQLNEKKYYYDIAEVYIKLKDANNASKYYNMWAKAFNTSDTGLENKIKQL